MLRYIWRIISLFFLLALSHPNVCAKDSEGKLSARPQAVFYGFYADVNVLDPIIHIFDPNRMGMDASLQVDLFHRLYPSFTMGYQTYDASGKYNYPIPAENATYEVRGLYYKVGVAANIWRKNYYKKLNPIAYIGANFAWSPRFSSHLSGYPMDNSFWNEGAENGYLSHEFDRNKACWLEVLMGMKAPVARHFCLGVEVMFKPFLRVKEVEEDGYVIHHSYAPGYGSKINSKWGFRYTLSYYFSFFKGGAVNQDAY